LSSPLSSDGEVGDLCEGKRGHEGNFAYQRIWSNRAAKMGSDPCLPSDPTSPYYRVELAPGPVRMMSPGEVAELTFSGWSTAPAGTFEVLLQYNRGNLTPNVRDPYLGTDASFKKGLSVRLPDAPVLTNGESGHLTFTVPSDAQSGQLASFVIYAQLSRDNYTRWPFAIVVR
jgi:hypothetical protein